MFHRICYTKKLGKLQQPFVPVNFKEYGDIYVYCDSDPIGYYLSYKKIPYHAIEDGLNCILHYDTAKIDPVDTNGAGDTFHGAFVAAYAMGEGIDYCCRFASAVAAYKCTHVGARDYELNMDIATSLI